uniref:Cathepsin propeptide inhibitor domain-containing protein n=1 Tax=Ditylenchus dipsaci TaxID=166011 RepID=A0A915E381_9BILA
MQRYRKSRKSIFQKVHFYLKFENKQSFPTMAEKPDKLPDDTDWQTYKQFYEKVYEDPEEEKMRQEIFLVKQKNILEHNERYRQHKESYAIGLNYMSDQTREEWAKLRRPLPDCRDSMTPEELLKFTKVLKEDNQ